MDKCLICGEYKFWNTHECDPKFYVWQEGEIFSDIYESKHNKIFARNHEKAAIKYAEQDYDLPNCFELNVISDEDINYVLDNFPDEDGFTEDMLLVIENRTLTFEMEGELVRQFWATKKS